MDLIWPSRKLTLAFCPVCLFIYFFLFSSTLLVSSNNLPFIHIGIKGVLGCTHSQWGEKSLVAQRWVWTGLQPQWRSLFEYLFHFSGILYLFMVLPLSLPCPENLGYLPSPWILSFLPGAELPGHLPNTGLTFFSSILLTIRTHT